MHLHKNVFALLLTSRFLLLVAAADQLIKPAAVLYQQDEHELLGDWIMYHGDIFGYSNIYIVDHGSSMLSVKNTLRLAEKMGVNVMHDDRPYALKHISMTEAIETVFEEDPTIDVILPFDIDEFVVARVGDTYSASADTIRGIIGALPDGGFKYKFEFMNAAACSQNVLVPYPRRLLNAVLFTKPNFGSKNKTFFHRNGFVRTDHGNHSGRVKADDECDGANEDQIQELRDVGVTYMDNKCFYRTSLALIHYGRYALTFTSFKAKMKRGFEAHGFSLEGECHGIGVQYCREWRKILQNHDARRQSYEKEVCNPNFTESTFMAAAFLGDRSHILQFPPDVTLA